MSLFIAFSNIKQNIRFSLCGLRLAIYTSAEVQVYMANIQCREVNLVFPPMQVKDNAGIVDIINNFESYA